MRERARGLGLRSPLPTMMHPHYSSGEGLCHFPPFFAFSAHSRLSSLLLALFDTYFSLFPTCLFPRPTPHRPRLVCHWRGNNPPHLIFWSLPKIMSSLRSHRMRTCHNLKLRNFSPFESSFPVPFSFFACSAMFSARF